MERVNKVLRFGAAAVITTVAAERVASQAGFDPFAGTRGVADELVVKDAHRAYSQIVDLLPDAEEAEAQTQQRTTVAPISASMEIPTDTPTKTSVPTATLIPTTTPTNTPIPIAVGERAERVNPGDLEPLSVGTVSSSARNRVAKGAATVAGFTASIIGVAAALKRRRAS